MAATAVTSGANAGWVLGRVLRTSFTEGFIACHDKVRSLRTQTVEL
jgi:hypothetical protein